MTGCKTLLQIIIICSTIKNEVIKQTNKQNTKRNICLQHRQQVSHFSNIIIQTF